MSELHHECGLVAVYHLGNQPQQSVPEISDEALADAAQAGSCTSLPPDRNGHEPELPQEQDVAKLIPRMLLDIQNRGQLSAGMTSYNPLRRNLLETYRNLGGVSEVFLLNKREQAAALMKRHTGSAAIGHVRYATCGGDDVNFAQPFERTHLHKRKWFSLAFNGQLANYKELRDATLADDHYHLSRDTDTEIILHECCLQFSNEPDQNLFDLCRHFAKKFDGAWCLMLLNARGELLVARDPLGLRPMCYAQDGKRFAAASESVALINLGFSPDEVKSLDAGCAIVISEGKVQVERYTEEPQRAHCFFEWIYFANVASTLDNRSVYLSRKSLGEELAKLELEDPMVRLDEDTIIVPVPDTSKAAADAMAFKLKIPSVEGLIRNRYAGRTFIEGASNRYEKAKLKYTPLREVLEGKRVILVEDSIVRSTTMRVLLDRIRESGRAKEVHVRVACPPIVAPCFYGIDMSRIRELFASDFLNEDGRFHLSREVQERMAEELGCNSLRYLPISSIARAIQIPGEQLCQACITGHYPTNGGKKLYQIALAEDYGDSSSETAARPYESHVG
ncbi:Amidophosphoribosyltransferase [Planctomycetales bacterium 10988]|nr:Amidophosphoribosyltransferase [Planctomycetales bacterium 10988]